MAITLPQALEKFEGAGRKLMAGVAKSIVTIDQLAAAIPIRAVSGTGMNIQREGILPTGGAFIDDTGTTSEESTGRDDYVHVPFRRIVGNVDVDQLLNVMTDGAEEGIQADKKIKATWRQVQQTIVNGARVTGHTFSAAGAPFTALSAAVYGPWHDSLRRGPGAIKYTHSGTTWQFMAPGDNAYGDAVTASSNGTYTLKSFNQSKWIRFTITVATAVADGECLIRFTSSTNAFEGLSSIVDPAMSITSGGNGDAFDISMFDALMDLQKVYENRAFITSGKIVNKYYAALRALGGTQPPTVMLPGYGSPVPTYQGIPILVNDFLPDETVGSGTCHSIYLASLNDEQGLFLGAASYGGESAIVNVDPRKRPVLGFQFEHLGALEGKDHHRMRVKWIGALGLMSALALARRPGVIRT